MFLHTTQLFLHDQVLESAFSCYCFLKPQCYNCPASMVNTGLAQTS
uniref:Uncharacterized protein n=1 Tax=Arundo donax TaxID=35708 RepID=A0A0A9ARI7_ARUDO